MSLPQQELARDLGFLEAYTIGVGTMIGAGIFVLPGIVAGMAGPASMISFTIAGVVSLLTALSLSELATGMPKAGGSYYYVNRAMGTFFGSVVGWAMWSGLMFATAFYMLGFGQYLTYFYGNMPIGIAALVMSVLLVALNYRGTKETGAVQNVIVILLLGFILVFVTFGVFNVDWDTLRPFNPEGWGAVASTAATVYVTYIGFEVIATSAEEIKNPGRNLPLSMIAAVLTPMLFYVLVMLVSTGVLPIAELTDSFIPVADAAGQYLGTFGALMMVIGAVLATISSANASILSAARVNFAMGRDKILTEWLNAVHPTFRTPGRAILVTGAVILLLIVLDVGIDTLADVASFSFLVTYGLVHIAVIVMRRADPADYNPDFKLPSWSYPAVPLVGALACFGIVLQMRPIVLLIGGLVILVGVLWFLLYARTHTDAVSLVGEAIVGAPREAPLNGHYRVVVPVANPETQRQLLRLAAATAAGHANAEIVAVNVIEVPEQATLGQGAAHEEERLERQRKLLANARDYANELGVGLRTRAIVGRDVWRVVLNVIEEENAQQVVLGWTGERKRLGSVLGSNIDQIVRQAPCEVDLIKVGGREAGQVVALIGEGPNAPLGARRAKEFFDSAGGTSLTLLTAQSPEETEAGDAEARGNALIDSVANQVGLEDFAREVVVREDVRGALLEAAQAYDTVCMGATRSTAVTQALFGSIPEEIGGSVSGTVAIASTPQQRPRTISQAVVERLTG